MNLRKLFRKYFKQAQFFPHYLQGLEAINERIDVLFNYSNAVRTPEYIQCWKRAESHIWRELYQSYFLKSDRILADRTAYLAFVSSLYNDESDLVALNKKSLARKLSHYCKKECINSIFSTQRSSPLHGRYNAQEYPFKARYVAGILKIHRNWVYELTRRYCCEGRDYISIRGGSKAWLLLGHEAIEKIKENCPKIQRRKDRENENELKQRRVKTYAYFGQNIVRIYARMIAPNKWQAVAVCKSGRQLSIGNFQSTRDAAIATAWSLVSSCHSEEIA